MAYKAIPVTAAQVSGSHSDFPVYIKPSAMTGWEALTLAEAESIRFYSDEAKTTELAREVVSADEIHVKVGTFDDSTTIYADYDGIRADYATDATYGAENVWNNGYVAVYHMKEGSGTTLADSTANGFDGTLTHTTLWNSEKKFQNSLKQPNHNEIVNLPDISGEFDNEATFTGWLKSDGTNGDDHRAVFLLGLEEGAGSHYFFRGDTDSRHFVGMFRDSRDITWTPSGVTRTDWNKITITTKPGSNNYKYYINGVLRSQVDGQSTISSGTSISIFAVQSFGRSTGLFAEKYQITSFYQDDNWITTEYNNQNDVASFWGTVTDVEEPAPSATLGLKLGSTTINKVMLGSTEIKKVYLGTTVIYENL